MPRRGTVWNVATGAGGGNPQRHTMPLSKTDSMAVAPHGQTDMGRNMGRQADRAQAVLFLSLSLLLD